MSSNKNLFTLKGVLIATVLAAIYGFLVPFLLSETNTAAVLAGVGLIVAGAAIGTNKLVSLVRARIDRDADKTERKTNCCGSHSFALLILTAALMATSSACSVERVPPGNVGILVYASGSSKGVDHEVVGVGWQFLSLNQQLYLFPTYQQNYVWTASPHEGKVVDEHLEFQTKEGMVCKSNVGISYHLDPTKITDVFQKYRKGIDEITDVFLRNQVRDALTDEASKLSVEEIYGNGKVELFNKTQERVSAQTSPIGIIIDRIYMIDAITLPPQVTAALNAKIQATQEAQQRENEVAKAKAEADIKIAQARGDADSALMRATAEAKANQLKLQTLTPELIRYEAIQKWDGKLPQITGGGTIPMIQIDSGPARAPAK